MNVTWSRDCHLLMAPHGSRVVYKKYGEKSYHFEPYPDDLWLDLFTLKRRWGAVWEVAQVPFVLSLDDLNVSNSSGSMMR